jgi:hypothetical protein
MNYSYDLATLPHPPPPPREQVVSLSHSSCVAPVKQTEWRGRRGEGGVGAISCDGEKAWSSINHSILSGCFQKISITRFRDFSVRYLEYTDLFMHVFSLMNNV